MKISVYINLLLALLLVSFASCKPNEPRFEYKYDYNPVYTWGQAEFYGDYYSDVDIDLNVLTLSLFSDSLYANNKGQLAGFGQYLFIEDVFIALGDTIMPDGIYRTDTIAQPFTFYPGEQLSVDDNRFNIGAYMYFIEKRAAYSLLKFIARGQFEVKTIGAIQSIVCDFVMSDSTKVTGKFSSKLYYFDQSVSTPAGAVRKKLIVNQ